MSFLFLSGEVSSSLPLCMRRKGWQHTTVARWMKAEDGRVKYGALPTPFDAVLWYCSVDDIGTLERNLLVIQETGVPCWPDVNVMWKWRDRRTKLFHAVAQGFVESDVEFVHFDPDRVVNRDTVLKVGNVHVGEGKFLVKKGERLPYYINLATLEPFVEGRSVRAYVVGDLIAGVEYTNDESWIKNGPGADTFEVELSSELQEHARRVHDFYEFPVSGIDYIVRPDGTFRFLEHNHFPGVTLHSKVELAIVKLFEGAMDALETSVG